MRLLRAEWTRFFARRFTLVLVLVVAGITALTLLNAGLHSSRVTESVRARAAVEAQQANERNNAQILDLRNSCLRDILNGVPGAEEKFGPNCQYLQPYYQPVEDFLPHSFNFFADFEQTVYVLAVLMMLIGFCLGASFIGAEWSSNSLTNLLLWRPNRQQVLWTKLAAALLGVGTVVLGLAALWTGGYYLLAATDGYVGPVTSGFWQSIALTEARGILLALIGAACGFALASTGRHTAMALGVGTAYGLFEVGSLVYFDVFGGDFPQRYRLSSYVIAWLDKKYEVYQSHCGVTGCVDQSYAIGTARAAVVIAIVAVVLLGLAGLSMQRRDVSS